MTLDKTILIGALALVGVALLAMATLHESHYKGRRSTILDARLRGVEGRLEAVETILTEDRTT